MAIVDWPSLFKFAHSPAKGERFSPRFFSLRTSQFGAAEPATTICPPPKLGVGGAGNLFRQQVLLLLLLLLLPFQR